MISEIYLNATKESRKISDGSVTARKNVGMLVKASIEIVEGSE